VKASRRVSNTIVVDVRTGSGESLARFLFYEAVSLKITKPSPHPAPRHTRLVDRRLSLRTELLLNLAMVVATALFLGVASVMFLYGVLDPRFAAIYISILVALDLSVLVAYVAYQVDKVVLKPLHEAMASAEAIAAGDLARRLGEGDTLEINNLAASVNRMTDRLLEERTHLVRAEKMASVGRLAAGVAHEVGNPLGAINGYMHLLRTAPPGSPEAREALEGLEREAARIDRIVKGLLDYARPKARKPEEIDLNEATRNVVELLTTQGALKYIQFELNLAKEPPHVSGDRHELEQAFVNLVLNAVDAMNGRGSLSIIVRRTTRAEMVAGARRATDPDRQPLHSPNARALRWLESSDSDNVAMVAISDSGPGILVEDSERIFEPFYTTKEPGKGTGLGLAIVARAIENCGGTIWVSRSREGGAAFRMLLPTVAADKRIAVSARPTRPPPTKGVTI
jgi:signal transduction histidine kinase